MKIKHENISKIMYIHIDQFTPGFIEFIGQQLPTYKDRVMEEDIYSTDDLREGRPDIPEAAETVLAAIDDVMKPLDCSYFRIIKPYATVDDLKSIMCSIG